MRAKETIEDRPYALAFRRPEPMAGDQEPGVLVGDGQRVAIDAVPGPKVALEVGRPEVIGVGGRGRDGARMRRRTTPAAALHQPLACQQIAGRTDRRPHDTRMTWRQPLQQLVRPPARMGSPLQIKSAISPARRCGQCSGARLRSPRAARPPSASRAAQVQDVAKTVVGRARALQVLPAWLFRPYFWISTWIGRRYPGVWKKHWGTVTVSAVGMFGQGAGWGIPPSSPSLCWITVGGMGQKQEVVDGHTGIRDYLSLTVSVDHNIIDGAPAARFAERLKELIESAYGLIDTA
jgi:hypothetical protein